jgi:hypothetical protein
MKLSNFIEGLKTLQPYYTDGDGYHIGAEHDQFDAYTTDKPLTREDQLRMCELGWFQPEGGMSSECGEYDPDNGWSAFT